MKSSCSYVCPDSELFVLDQNSRLPKSGSGAWKPDILVGTLESRSSLMLVSTMCRIRCDWSDWVHGKIKPEEHSPHQQSSFEVCVCACASMRERDWYWSTCWLLAVNNLAVLEILSRSKTAAKFTSLQHCRERTGSLKGYEWVCICCWVCVMMWANNNTKN